MVWRFYRGLGHLQHWLALVEKQPGIVKSIAVPYSVDKLLLDENEQQKNKFLNKAREMLHK